jgi:hypothetical protein
LGFGCTGPETVAVAFGVELPGLGIEQNGHFTVCTLV